MNKTVASIGEDKILFKNIEGRNDSGGINNSIKLKVAEVETLGADTLDGTFTPDDCFLFGISEMLAHLQILKSRAIIEQRYRITDVFPDVKNSNVVKVEGEPWFTHHLVFSRKDRPEYKWLLKFDEEVFDIEKTEDRGTFNFVFRLKNQISEAGSGIHQV